MCHTEKVIFTAVVYENVLVQNRVLLHEHYKLIKLQMQT